MVNFKGILDSGLLQFEKNGVHFSLSSDEIREIAALVNRDSNDSQQICEGLEASVEKRE